MPPRRKIVTVTVAVLAWSVGWVVLAAPATAATGTYLRLAQLSPDTADTDLYVASVSDPDRAFVVPGVGYGSTSTYRRIEPGTYLLSVREAGASVNSTPMLGGTLTARPESASTVAVLGMRDDRGLEIISDDLAPATAGQSRARVINAAASAPRIDVGVVGGPMVASGVDFAMATPYENVMAGALTLQVGPPGRPAVTLLANLDPNCVHTVLVVDRAGQLAVEVVTDARGSSRGVVPVGGMNAGFGGLAAGLPIGKVAALVLLAAAAGLVGVILARPQPNRPT